jgi:hypothetical protein
MLASTTRLDILFTQSKLSQFVSNPGDDHWDALERVMLKALVWFWLIDETYWTNPLSK